MATTKKLPPMPPHRSSTKGSATVGKSMDTRGLRQVAIYLPTPWHAALIDHYGKKHGMFQSLFNRAASKYFGTPGTQLPPLVTPTHPRTDPHVICTWYADVDLHFRIKTTALLLRSSVQQLMLSAIVDCEKSHLNFKALDIETGAPALAKTPRPLKHPV